MKHRSSSSYKNIFWVLPFLILLFFVSKEAEAATNINSSTTLHWAWNDIIGWIDFYSTLNVNVFSNRLEGYASSSAGNIYLASTTYQVTNDGSGNLSGWAWNDTYGWISFDCHNTGGCGTSLYEVLINPSTGDFSNYAWNDTVGWISFCGNTGGTGGCAQVSTSSFAYKVNTTWTATSTSGYLDSSTFDTGVGGGAQLNSVLWHGQLPSPANGASVNFQFAVSNASSGPWNFVGPGGSASAYYTGPPDTSIKLDYNLFNNFRYFRYRTTLFSNASSTQSPRVDEILVNWSP
jgi:hypothetical protein